MAEKSDFQIPWLALFALLGGGGLWHILSLPSTPRPDPPETREHPVSGEAEFADARLWEDPFCHGKKKPETCADFHRVLAGIKSNGLILPVMVPGKPYVEDVETRLRIRQAVVHAFAVNGLHPERNSEIGTTCFPNSISTIPYECFKSDTSNREAPSFVVVLWLSDDDFREQPLKKMNALFERVRTDTEIPATHVLGPASSGILRAMLEEAGQLAGQDTPVTHLRSVKIYSCLATASEDNLLHGLNIASDDTCERFLERNVQQAGGKDFTFQRITLTDDKIAQTIHDELARRRIKNGNGSIAILTEHDTYYARALERTFRRTFAKWDDQKPSRLHSFHYLRGLDGKLPGATNSPGKRSTKAEGNLSGPVIDPPDGLNQTDYIRRIAEKLVLLNRMEPIRAVGVLGSDIYDKLEILAALRPVLPHALFFTNTLDARYFHPDDWSKTRNLVVVSGSGLSFADAHQQGAPPFRDSTQATVFLAVNTALGKKNSRPIFQPLVFEIGRAGPVELGPERVSDGIHPRPPDDSIFTVGLSWLNPISIVLLGVALSGILLATFLERNAKYTWIAIAVIGGIVLLPYFNRWVLQKSPPFAIFAVLPFAALYGFCIWANRLHPKNSS